MCRKSSGVCGYCSQIAGRWGVPFHEEDLGLTLGTWGVPEGPYLVVPILGPSTPRDLGGQVAEGFGDPWNRLVTGSPWNLYWIPFVRGGVAGGICERGSPTRYDLRSVQSIRGSKIMVRRCFLTAALVLVAGAFAPAIPAAAAADPAALISNLGNRALEVLGKDATQSQRVARFR